MSTRTHKTPAQRAQERVDVLDRRLKRVVKAKEKLKEELADLQRQQEVIADRLKYAMANPDLPQNEAVK